MKEHRRTATGGKKARSESEGAHQDHTCSAIAAAFGWKRKSRRALGILGHKSGARMQGACQELLSSFSL